MIRISLLPPELKKQQRSREMKGTYLKIAAGVAAVFLLIFLSLLLLTMGANRELDRLRSERQVLEQQIAQLREYEVMEAKINELNDLGREVVGRQPNWGTLLASVGDNLPAEVWLTDIASAAVEDAREVTIRGFAPGHRLVADWLNEMHELESLENIRAQFSSESIVDGQTQIQFEIKAFVIPEEPQSPLERGGA